MISQIMEDGNLCKLPETFRLVQTETKILLTNCWETQAAVVFQKRLRREKKRESQGTLPASTFFESKTLSLSTVLSVSSQRVQSKKWNSDALESTWGGTLFGVNALLPSNQRWISIRYQVVRDMREVSRSQWLKKSRFGQSEFKRFS